MKVSTTLIFVTIAMIAGGCTQSDSVVADPNDGIWVVGDSGEIEGGAQLLMMEHGEWEDTGEFVAFDTYGLPIRDGDRRIFLLWTNSPNNPFGLQPGDRFRFADSIADRYFDDQCNGYHARTEDIEIVED